MAVPLVRVVGCLAGLMMVVGAAHARDADDAVAIRVANASPTDVSDVLAPIIEKHNAPGMAVAVVRDGKLVAIGARGVRARGESAVVTTNDLWHLGSCTKSMTATLCAVLVDRGVLKWDVTLAEAFPEAAPEMHDEYKVVTLRQLLTNRGGIPGDLNADGLWGKLWKFEGTSTEARRLLLKTITSKAPKTKPGTFEYSNGGFAIAGLVAEHATGRSWEELMQAEVFTPLGITTAGFGAPGTRAKDDGANRVIDQPRGHSLLGGAPVEPGKNADNPAAIGPAGTVHMSIGDWAKYVVAHLDGEEPMRDPSKLLDAVMAMAGDRPLSRPGDLVSIKQWSVMHTPAPKLTDKDTDYAMGWGVTKRPWAKGDGPDDTGLTLTHNGSNTMWYCVAWLAPERNLGVVVCVNQAGTGTKAADDAATAMIGRFAKREK